MQMAEALSQSKEINPAHDKRIAVSVTIVITADHTGNLF